LTSDGSSYAANTIYTLTGISGTVTDNGVDTSVSTVGSDFGADNLFVWNGPELKNIFRIKKTRDTNHRGFFPVLKWKI
jgi:hypothetical protein